MLSTNINRNKGRSPSLDTLHKIDVTALEMGFDIDWVLEDILEKLMTSGFDGMDVVTWMRKTVSRIENYARECSLEKTK